MAENELAEWFRSIPIISRWWFGLSILFPLLGRFGLFHPFYMILNFHLVAYKFQIWRLITCFVFFPTNFHLLINLYFLYNYSTRLETGIFDGRPADYLFLLFFNSIILLFIGFALNLKLLMDAIILSVLYIWCQLNKDTVVSFWFGTQFKAMYLPWVLAAFNILLGHDGLMELIGIFVGHLYFFLMFKYPQDFGGRRLLTTPSFFYKYLPNRRGGVAGFGQAPAARRQPDERGGFPGSGNRLGGE